MPRQSNNPAKFLCCIASLALIVGCAAPSRMVRPPERGGEKSPGKEMLLPLTSFRQIGMASYYGLELHDFTTASGETYQMDEFTAAHPSLPFNTRVKVTNLSNNLSVEVRINDRGPYTKRRIIDLSYAAAKEIGLIEASTARVEIEVVKP